MKTEIRLTPEQEVEFLDTARYLDGFADGVRMLAERMKKRKLDEIVAARNTEPIPNSPKED